MYLLKMWVKIPPISKTLMTPFGRMTEWTAESLDRNNTISQFRWTNISVFYIAAYNCKQSRDQQLLTFGGGRRPICHSVAICTFISLCVIGLPHLSYITITNYPGRREGRATEWRWDSNPQPCTGCRMGQLRDMSLHCVISHHSA